MPVLNQITIPRTMYIHKETTNQTFLDMHYYLKDRGIQNNDFFLGLFDVGLASINPRDPNLPLNMKARVLRECQINYWYFLREVVLVPEAGSAAGGGSRYRLNRGNLAMNFLFTLNFNMYVEMPRQTGKTIGALCRYLWIYNFGTTNSEIMFMHKAHDGSKNNLKSLRAIRDALPAYLRFDSSVNAEGKKLKVPNTIVTMQHPFNNNKINTYPSARTPDAANNLGRGATIPLQFYDEFAFMPYNRIVMNAASPAFSQAATNAAKNNAPFGMLITTTPGDLLTDNGKYCYEFIRNKATPWIEDYYDLTYEELNGLREANKESTLFLIKYTYQQLGKGPEYFKEIVKLMSADWAAIRREILLEWSAIATDCPFTQEELDIIKSYNREPIRTITFGRFKQYQFHIYDNLDLDYPPIIGVDVAGATFRDSSAITVIDSRSTKVCATLACNFIPADDLAQVIYELVTKYMPSAIICIEANGGFGKAVIQRLCKTSVKKNLYWEIKDKVIEETFDGFRMNKTHRKVKVFGLDSTKDVRARLIEILMERVKLHKDKFIAPILHEEMKAMQVKRNGKVEHSDDSHDDVVFSYLMALYVWYDGKNLAENFNIRKSSLKTDIDEEIEEEEFGNELEHKEFTKLDNNIYDEYDEKGISETLAWVEKDARSFITNKDLEEQQRLELINNRNSINKEELNTVHLSLSTNKFNNANTELPLDLYYIDDDIDYNDDNYDPYSDYDVVQGNLSDIFRTL